MWIAASNPCWHLGKSQSLSPNEGGHGTDLPPSTELMDSEIEVDILLWMKEKAGEKEIAGIKQQRAEKKKKKDQYERSNKREDLLAPRSNVKRRQYN